jgi:rubredoxin
MMMETKMWMCRICGWVYDEQEGCSDEGIMPGTLWENMPEEWVCPECGAHQFEFEMTAL